MHIFLLFRVFPGSLHLLRGSSLLLLGAVGRGDLWVETKQGPAGVARDSRKGTSIRPMGGGHTCEVAIRRVRCTPKPISIRRVPAEKKVLVGQQANKPSGRYMVVVHICFPAAHATLLRYRTPTIHTDATRQHVTIWSNAKRSAAAGRWTS